MDADRLVLPVDRLEQPFHRFADLKLNLDALTSAIQIQASQVQIVHALLTSSLKSSEPDSAPVNAICLMICS
ncbi:hypothetical protein D3C85_1647130 [compost metagenome]